MWTSSPRRASVSASSEPTGPAPTITTSGFMEVRDQRPEALDVLERVVERRRRDADDVRRAQIDDRSAPGQLGHQPCLAEANGEHRAALLRREHLGAAAAQE